MPLLHVPTAFLLLGLLYFMMAALTWTVLSGLRTRSIGLWCGGGLLAGAAFVLVALRGQVPAWAGFPLANLLSFVYIMLRIQSLRIDLSVPWRWSWVTVAGLLFVLVHEGIRLGLENLRWMIVYNNSVYTASLAYLAALAWHLGHQEKSLSLRWIAYAYFLGVCTLLLNVIAFSMGWATPLPNALDSSSARVGFVFAALPMVVITHIAYIGFILERTHRQTIEAEKRYHGIIETTLEGFWVCDLEGRFVDVNRAYCEMIGYSRDELLGMRISDVEFNENPADTRAHIQRIMQTGYDRFESRHRCKDGKLLDVEISTNFQSARFRELQVFIRDITERKATERQLRLIQFAVDKFSDEVFIIRSDTSFHYVNDAACRMLEYSREELMAMTVPDIDPVYDKAVAEVCWQAVKDAGSLSLESQHRSRSGRIFPVEINNNFIEYEGAGYVCNISRDITERKQAEDEIKQLAFYDPLTQLPNRRLLLDRLQQALVTGSRSKLYGALLFIDLDNFKTLNDTLGHDTGDLLLQQVAIRLTLCVRECDTVSRFGGDEFVVMLTDLDGAPEEAAAGTQKVGRKILDTLNQVYYLAGHEHYCSASIGITLFVGHRSSLEELLKQADIALYQAKTAGRNALCFFDPQMQSSIAACAELFNDLRNALAKNQLTLFFQIAVGHNHQPFGAEALLRWHHPHRGLLPPQEFIPLAEKSALINPIGLWVLETACTLLKLWEKRPHLQHLQLAVNISVRQFHQPDFVDWVLKILRDTHSDPARLTLELTENVVLADIDDAIAKMTALKQVGVRFALDDFGTGYSSLAYLTRLPFDQLKIDRSFVQNIGVESSDAVIIQTIIVMANQLGMEVIAEGVETESQLAFLQQHGCLVCQGYLLGKPVPLEEFEAGFM